MNRISIRQMIEEIDLERKYRADVFPRLIANGKMRQAIADYRNERLMAIRDLLVQLAQRDEDKDRLSY